MKKDKTVRSFSHLLVRWNESFLFRPFASFLPAFFQSGTEEKREKAPFLHAPVLKVKTALAKMAEQSFLLQALQLLIRNFFTTRIRSFGVLFFSCGFLQALSFFLRDYVPFFSGNEENLLFGVVMIFLTLLCSFSRGDVGDALKRSFFFRGFLRPFFGVQEHHIPSGKGRENVAEMLFWGITLAVFSVFLSPSRVFFLCLFAFYLLFVLFKPEAGLVFLTILFLFLPFSKLVFLTIFTVFSFFIKCAVGKRSVVVSPLPFAVLVAAFPLCAVFDTAALPLVVALFFLSLLILGLCRTTDFLQRLLLALSFGALLCGALILVRQAFTALYPAVFHRFPNLETILFLLPEKTLGGLSAILCPVILGACRSFEMGVKRGVCLLALLLNFGGMFLVGDSSVWLAALLGTLLFFLFSYRFSLLLIVMSTLSFVCVRNFLPEEWVRSFLALFGFGEKADAFSFFSQVCFFRQWFAHSGVFGALALIALLAVFLWSILRFSRIAIQEGIYPVVLGALVSAFIFLFLGATRIPFDYRIVFLFVLQITLPEAALRACRREEVRLPY